MDGREGLVAGLSRFVQKQFLWLIIGSYAVAAFAPALGLWIRDASLGSISAFGTTTRIRLSMVMLASLLLNAGLGVELTKIGAMLRRPLPMVAGLAANFLLPIVFILAVSKLMAGWHDGDEVQNILVGLALVAAMPIAGSSTAWTQNADGDLPLSLGLVLFSTLLSPFTTPVALDSVGMMTRGDYAEDLKELAAGGAVMFLALCVLAPSLIGIATRRVLGNRRYHAARPVLKLVNYAVLLLLNYSNASVSLPQAIRHPDLDFLAITLVIVLGLCIMGFAAGWAIARLLKSSPAQRTSLMFGLGMNNNGTGLVLASMALADHPRVMLPIIIYNLVQNLVAGAVDKLNSRAAHQEAPTGEPTPGEGSSAGKGQEPRGVGAP